MDDNIVNATSGESTGEQRCSLYLPSVKTWNQHIRRNTFVKDHTAVPLSTLQRDHSWNAQAETTLSSLNGSATKELSQPPSSDHGTFSQITPPCTQSTSLKKAFEMATRTRDILNKLDGWKALSFKTYPTSSQCTISSPAGYTIKSSSQFTTLDANSDEAKNILKNIKDMAQILCPSEYGGVSHFRITHDEKQTAEASIQNADPMQNNNFILNKPLDSATSNISMFHQSNPCISSSRINIIGTTNAQAMKYPSGILRLNEDNVLGTLSNNTSNMTSRTENTYRTSNILDSHTGNETQRYSIDKVKALYEDLMSKLNQKSQENTSFFEQPSDTKASDSLYEDFDDGSFTLMNQHPLASSISVNGHQESSCTLYSGMTENDHSTKEKDHFEWEKETQDFLRKLNVKSGGARKDVRESVGDAHRHSMETCKSRSKLSRDVLNRGCKALHGSSTRSASNSSSISLGRCGSDSLYSLGNKGCSKDISYENSRVSKRSEAKEYKLMESASLKGSSTGSFKKLSKKMMYFDDCTHACRDCGLSGLALTSYLDHLLTEEHSENMSDIPPSWEYKFDENLLDKQKFEKCLPIRGSESIWPVTKGFYCRPCKQYFPNKSGMLHHLTSKSHDEECYFYNNSRKRHCESSTTIPAKKSRYDSKDDNVKPSVITQKNNEVVKTIPIGTENKASAISTNPVKVHSNKVPLDKRDPKICKAKVSKQPLNKEKTDHDKHLLKSSMTELHPQKNMGVNPTDDLESESDFLELDEWTEGE